jgi:hypothetical protein
VGETDRKQHTAALARYAAERERAGETERQTGIERERERERAREEAAYGSGCASNVIPTRRYCAARACVAYFLTHMLD